MITVRDVSKEYDGIKALDHVSFSVEAGEVVGLLGPNGAGKSTMMRILTGYMQPSTGIVTINGLDMVHATRQAQSHIGYLPENTPLYSELTVQTYLMTMAELRGIPEKDRLRRLSETIRTIGLTDRLTSPIHTLSKGYRQRVGLAQALLHQPGLLILDEPTNGLDPTQIIEMRHLIRSLSHSTTIMVSSHILSEVEATCDRVLIIMGGRLLTDARLADLARTGSVSLTVEAENAQDVTTAVAALSGIDQVKIISENNALLSLTAQTTREDACPALYHLARANDWTIHELKRDSRTLERIFSELDSDNCGGIQ